MTTEGQKHTAEPWGSPERFEHDVLSHGNEHSTAPNRHLTIVVGGQAPDCDFVDVHGPNQETIARRIVAAVNACAGISIEALEANQVNALMDENQRLMKLLNTPEILDFLKAVPLEAAHQRERWDSDHDAGKTAADWFWLIGYLAGKALHCQIAGKAEKALHHTITAAAALCNWHAAILGKSNMRPGIELLKGEEAQAKTGAA